MVGKIKIAAVSYLNAKPFAYGLKNSPLINDIDLIFDNPARCSEKLMSGEVDLALVPLAAIPLLKRKIILSDYCISAEKGASVLLVKFLAKHHWCISPEWIDASEGYEKEIENDTAGLIIGDRVDFFF